MVINSIDDYIKLVHPEPDINSQDYGFFKAWGYEQYLIRKLKYDLEQLRILLQPDYNIFRLAKMVEGGKSLTDAVKGLPLVKSKKILQKFLLQSLPKGFPGILLWQENNKYFCIFPSRGSIFTQMMGDFTSDDIEITADVFTTEEDILGRINTKSVASGYEFQDHVCYLPDFGNIFVFKVWNNSMGYNSKFTMEYVHAEYNEKKKKWIYPKEKKHLIRKHAVDYANVENGRILDLDK